MIDLINKNVQVNDPSLIRYFFPQYKYVTNSFIQYSDKPIIYNGEAKYIKQLIERNIPYISLTGMPHYNFTIAEDLAKFVFSKFKGNGPNGEKEVPQYVKELLPLLSQQEVEQYCKQVWVTR